MKNYKQTLAYTFLAIIGLTFNSCTKDFTEVNTDPIGKSTTTANQLLAPALVGVLNANMSRNWNFNNQLMQVTVEINDSEGRVFRYDVRRTQADYTWNNWYLFLTDLKDIYTIASKPESLNKSYQGISLVAQTWVSQLLTDTYGDVPYSEANLGKEGNVQPKFDRQKDIYADMFAKLEQANQLLKDGTPINTTGDPVFQGDVSKWRRFCNSLYLRLLLRASGKAEVAPTIIAKIKQIVDGNPSEYPIMQNNTHTAKILWNGTNSSTAVFSSPFMVNIRAADFRGIPICNFFLGNLVTWDDPRMNSNLTGNNVNRFCIDAAPNGGFVGIPSGYAQGSGLSVLSHFNSDAENKPTLQTDRFTGIIMNAAEVDFILAEAAARGWISGPTEKYYYKGMVDAINYWLPNYISTTTDSRFIDYVQAANLDWDSTLPLDNTTSGNSQLEMIHIQKYYAMFLVDFQQWFEYRRTGHPILPKGPGLVNNQKMPARLNYPVVTQSTNPSSYNNAIAAQGADDINTLMWWQKP